MHTGATQVPVSVREWEMISEQGMYFKGGRYAKSSKVQINMSWNHCRSFCLRFNRPVFLRVDTKAEVVAAFQQEKLSLQYEVGLYRLKAESVAQKIWAVGAKHKYEFMEDRFSNKHLLRGAIANAVALDEPVKPKIPVSNETLQAFREGTRIYPAACPRCMCLSGHILKPIPKPVLHPVYASQLDDLSCIMS